MPAESSDRENRLRPGGEARSRAKGDVPDALGRRYFTDERGGRGLGFYVDAVIPAPAFRDRGHVLTATRADPNAIRDMVRIAEHRGWGAISVDGSAAFRREAWLAARAMGLEVQGYRASVRDLQELERRQRRLDRQADGREVRQERQDVRRERRDDQSEVARARWDAAARQAPLRVVEAVVRARVQDPDRQAEIMAAARDRIAGWLERRLHHSGIAHELGRREEPRDRQL